MSEKPKIRTGPCLEKNCSECCNPVKMNQFMPNDKVPKDKEGNDLWKKKNEFVVPADNPDGPKIELYDCKNFDPETGKCLDYENRPDVCKRSGCVDPDSLKSEADQFRRLSEKKFIKTK